MIIINWISRNKKPLTKWCPNLMPKKFAHIWSVRRFVLNLVCQLCNSVFIFGTYIGMEICCCALEAVQTFLNQKPLNFNLTFLRCGYLLGLEYFLHCPCNTVLPFFVVNETWWAGLFGFKCQSEGRGFRQAWGWGKGREKLGFQWCQKWVGQKWPRILREIFEVSQARPFLCAYHFISLCWGLLKRSLLTRPANCVCPSWSRRWKRNWMPQMWSLHSSCRWKRWDVELIGELMGCGKGHVHCTKIGRSSPLMSWGLFSYLSVPATIWAGFKEQRVSMFCIWSLCGQCIRMFGC